jgi:hypothetical protein
LLLLLLDGQLQQGAQLLCKSCQPLLLLLSPEVQVGQLRTCLPALLLHQLLQLQQRGVIPGGQCCCF